MTLDRQSRMLLVKSLYRSVLGREASHAEVETWCERICDIDDFEAALSAFLRSDERLNADRKPWGELPMFVPPGHFYSPVVDPKTLSFSRERTMVMSVPGIRIDHDDMLRRWNKFSGALEGMPFKAEASDDCRYRFDNNSFSYGDASVLYAMIRTFQPKRIVEIGGGWASACFVDSIQAGERPCLFTMVEPFPELVMKTVGPPPPFVNLVRSPIQEVPASSFTSLESNDVLFIDSTHVAKTGSDVLYIFFEILPLLKPGVLIHFHDIFWPFEYPDTWVINENRSWNETYFLRSFLYNNPAYTILFFNDFFSIFFRSQVEASYPLFLRNPGGSIWLQKAAS